MTDPAAVPDTLGPDAVPEVTRRRLARWHDPNPWWWLAVGLVTVAAAALRLVGITHPRGKIFDEVFYATAGDQLLKHLAEQRVETTSGVETELGTPEFVVHPPLGKWCIALGIKVFGYNELGWRIMPVVFGVASILVVILLARRLFRSTLLGCLVGLLMTLDGLHFVLSRAALLDIFLMAFLVFAFACLVYDRDRRRQRWLEALESGTDPNRRGRAGRPRLGFPGWRLSAALFTGCALSVKWSAVWYLALFLVLIVIWEAGTRRSAGADRPWLGALTSQLGWAVGYVTIAAGGYLASWAGWFASDGGWGRHWLRDTGQPEPAITGALQNLWRYHGQMLHFHVTLSQPHRYQSWPWQWILLGRPVPFSFSDAGPCGGTKCASEVLLLGTPLLWWSFPIALAALVWLGIARRDWRTVPIGLGVAAGIVPWFWSEAGDRTMYLFYVLPAEPFLLLAVGYVLGVVIGRDSAPGPVTERRSMGTIVAGAYIAVIAWCFAYFYPIYTGAHLTYSQWLARLWLGDRWV